MVGSSMDSKPEWKEPPQQSMTLWVTDETSRPLGRDVPTRWKTVQGVAGREEELSESSY